MANRLKMAVVDSIYTLLERGYSRRWIARTLRSDRETVRRYVQKLGRTWSLPFRRMECAPGAEAQVDFGSGAPVVIPEGQALPVGVKTRRRRPHAFRIVRSHSRKAYSEVVFRQTTEDFIRCLENAFWYFGGVPQTLVVDNLKAAVLQADWFDPELNPKLRDFCRHYGTETRDKHARFTALLHHVTIDQLRGSFYALKRDEEDFLGFTYVCARKFRTGGFHIKRRTMAKRRAAKRREVKATLRRCRHAPLAEQAQWLSAVLRGYFQYHAIPGNMAILWAFRLQCIRTWLRALRRRTQRHRLTWKRFGPLAECWLPKPRVLHPNPNDRFYAKHPK